MAIRAKSVSGDPSLSLPGSENVDAGATTTLPGIVYSDDASANNPGQLFLSIEDESGILRAADHTGAPIPGSGTNAITFSASYTDVIAALSSLTYTPGLTASQDNIRFDIWDQFGTETTGTIPVVVTTGSGGNETWTGAVSSDWNSAGNWSGNAVPVAGDSVVIPAGTSNAPVLSGGTLSGETIVLTPTGTALPSVTFTDVVLDAALSGSGTINAGGILTIGSQGTVSAQPGQSLTVASTMPITIINHGDIAADGGVIALNPASPINPDQLPPETIVNGGTIAIANGGSIWLNGTISGGDITFHGAGTLTIEQPMALTDGATISGFGMGDMIDLLSASAGHGGQLSFADGNLQVINGGSLVQSLPFSGAYGLGNFVNDFIAASPSEPTEIAFAPDGGPSGIVSPDISAPATATVSQGSTLGLGGVAISNLGSSGFLFIDAGSGTLYMNGATDSGSSHLKLGPLTNAAINADLASLIYVPAAGANGDVVNVHATPGIAVETFREIPITITSSMITGPTLSVPASEHVAAGSDVAVTTSYTDSFAETNPGRLFLSISDDSGTLRASDAAGNPVAGSGSNSIALDAGYVDLNAILASLHYTGGTSGTDTIRFDVWNQAGVETTGATIVTIDAPGLASAGALTTMADEFAPLGPVPSAGASVDATNHAAGPMFNTDAAHIWLPPILGR